MGLLRRRSSRRSRVLVVVAAAAVAAVAVAPWNQTPVGVEVWFPLFWKICNPSCGKEKEILLCGRKEVKPQGVSGEERKKQMGLEQRHCNGRRKPVGGRASGFFRIFTLLDLFGVFKFTKLSILQRRKIPTAAPPEDT